MPKRKLPKFRRPPVNEVVCCAYFVDLSDLQSAHLGKLWARLGKRYSRTQSVAPLPPVNLPIQASLKISFSPPGEPFELPRTWFMDESGASLVQVQRDRLVFNWRRVTPDEAYPSYSSVIREFRRIYRAFLQFVTDFAIGELRLTGIELCYVNHITYGRELNTVDELPKVINFLSWHSSPNLASALLRTMICNLQFERPEKMGQLTLACQTAQRLQDGQELIRFDLVARHLAENISELEVWPWFDNAHECIVTTFVDVTTPEIQRNIWERYK